MKLGYGGTQSEMKRLIQDASKLTDVQEELGVSVDANSMSFDNCVAAIHVMQKSMQVGGTTAREAATTIEGSVNAMKAAWENWVTGLADSDADMQELTENLVESIATAAENIVPRITEILTTAITELPQLVSTLAPVLGETFGQLFSTALDTLWGSLPSKLQGTVTAAIGALDQSGISDTLKGVMDGAVSITDVDWDGLFEGLTEFLESDTVTSTLTVVDGLVNTIVNTFKGAADMFETNLKPALEDLDTAWTNLMEDIEPYIPVLETLGTGVGQVLVIALTGLVEILTALITIVDGVIEGLTEFGANMADNTQTVMNFAGGIGEAFGALGETIGGALEAVMTVIGGWVGSIGEAASSAGESFKVNIQTKLSEVPGIVSGIVGSIVASVGTLAGQLYTSAVTAATNFKTGLETKFNEAVVFVSGIPGRISSAIGNCGSTLYNAGSKIIGGFLNGLKSKWGEVTSFVSGIATWIANNKGPIEYDRRLLIPAGKAIMQSLHQGLNDEWGSVQSLVSGMADGIADGFGGLAVDAPSVTAPNRGLWDAVTSTGARADGSIDGILARLDTIAARLDEAETAIYVDGKKLASTIAKPMNQQLGRLAARGC